MLAGAVTSSAVAQSSQNAPRTPLAPVAASETAPAVMAEAPRALPALVAPSAPVNIIRTRSLILQSTDDGKFFVSPRPGADSRRVGELGPNGQLLMYEDSQPAYRQYQVATVEGEPGGVYRLMVDSQAEQAMVQGPFLGIGCEPVSPEVAAHLPLPAGVGLRVHYVAPESPAAAAGLMENDVLSMLEDQQLVNAEQFAVLIRLIEPGETATLQVTRRGANLPIEVTPEMREVPELQPGGRLASQDRFDEPNDLGLWTDRANLVPAGVSSLPEQAWSQPAQWPEVREVGMTPIAPRAPMSLRLNDPERGLSLTLGNRGQGRIVIVDEDGEPHQFEFSGPEGLLEVEGLGQEFSDQLESLLVQFTAPDQAAEHRRIELDLGNEIESEIRH